MIRLLPLFFLCFWASSSLQSQVFPVDNILVNGTNDKRINLVYLSDGYQSAELAAFTTKANSVTTALFNQSPFLEYKNFFNVYAIKVPSTESGAKHAGTATDVTEPASPIMNPNNYFGSRFDVSNIHRLLVPASSGQVATVASANVPEYDQLLVLVNSTEYGGSGGTVATSSVNNSANEIMYHEIGHSFANLGDEYWFNCSERKNRTANNNPATIIWDNWLNSNGVGIYPIGSSGAAASCYRPHQNCKMQVLGVPYCSVCKEAFIDRVYQLVSPINSFSPAGNNVNFVGPSMNFNLTLVLPNPNTLQVEWVLNGTTIATSGSSVNIATNQLNNGNNTLQAKVTDATLLSRAYWPGTSGYLHSVTWTIQNAALPVELLDFTATSVGETTVLSWETRSERDADYFDVEKSEDGITFTTIGRVTAAGDSKTVQTYQLIDPSPLSGATYYRLRQVDRSGAETFSPIRVVQRIDKIRYEIFPNPASEVLQVRLHTQVKDAFSLRIVDMQGRILYEQNNDPSEALTQSISLQGFPAGQYSLVIQMGANVISTAFQKE